jgi:hypothetical protein
MNILQFKKCLFIFSYYYIFNTNYNQKISLSSTQNSVILKHLIPKKLQNFGILKSLLLFSSVITFKEYILAVAIINGSVEDYKLAKLSILG